MAQGRGSVQGPAKPEKLKEAKLVYERPVQKKMILEKARVPPAPRVTPRKSARGGSR